MFTQSSEIYDLVYGLKNYSLEAAHIATLVRSTSPQARTVLDVACGTGEHARILARDQKFKADGLDADTCLLRVARRKHPEGRFYEGEMSAFALDQRYDAVLCLFGSIAYLRTLDRVRQAFACFRKHVDRRGVVVVEPWHTPDALESGYLSKHKCGTEETRVERTSHIQIDDRIARVEFSYRIESRWGVRFATELHELGLFTQSEMSLAFLAAGMSAHFDPVGLTGRGLWTARVASSVSA